jgi:lipopolysaccharide export system protein LptA
VKSLVFALAALVLLAPSLAGAAEQGGQVATDITSERMTYLQQGQKVIFEGKVQVTRPDFRLTSERLTVFFSQGKEQAKTEGALPVGAGEIRRIEAEGQVRLEREGRVGTCARAIFDMEQQLITMEGDPILEDGKNRISGKVIRFHLADNRSEVIGDKNERVKATFFTPERKGQGNQSGARE